MTSHTEKLQVQKEKERVVLVWGSRADPLTRRRRSVRRDERRVWESRSWGVRDRLAKWLETPLAIIHRTPLNHSPRPLAFY